MRNQLVMSLTSETFLQCFVRAEVQGFASEYESAFAMLPFGKSFPKSHAHLLHDAVALQVSPFRLNFITLEHFKKHSWYSS